MLSYSLTMLVLKKSGILLWVLFSSLWCMIRNIYPPQVAIKFVFRTGGKKSYWLQISSKCELVKHEMFFNVSLSQLLPAVLLTCVAYHIRNDLQAFAFMKYLFLNGPDHLLSKHPLWRTPLLAIWKTAASQCRCPKGASSLLLRCRERQ